MVSGVDFPFVVNPFSPPFRGDDTQPSSTPEVTQRPGAIPSWRSCWTMRDTKLAISTFRTWGRVVFGDLMGFNGIEW